MKQIRWFVSHPERELHDRLADFDHHRITINGEIAVLITYVNMDNPGGLFAVVHSAAGKHPLVPNWVKDAVARLAWEPCLPPRR